MTEPAWPMAWAAPMGARTFQPSDLISGVLRMPVAQSSMTKGTPTKSELSDIIHGMGKALSTRLLLMLYLVRAGAGGGVRVKARRVEVRVGVKRGQYLVRFKVGARVGGE